MNKIAAALLLFVLASPAAFARSVPPLTGPVVDEAKLFDAQRLGKLQNELSGYYASSGIQLQVLTVKSLEGENLEAFSIRVADAWKIGKADTDRGLIMIVAPKEHQARLEVGQGLEGEIPDAIASRIINDTMIPRFKAGDYPGGIEAGIKDIGTRVGVVAPTGARAASAEDILGPSPQKPSWWFVATFLLALIFFFLPGILWLLFGIALGTGVRSVGGRRTFGGFGGGFSGGSGGGWSGGGGGFSGGGASGRW